MHYLQDKIDLIWKLAELLRHDYQQRENADVILPLVVLRRLDQAMAPTRQAVRAAYERYTGKLQNLDAVLSQAAGGSLVYNHSEFDWDTLLNAPTDVAPNLINYLNGYSPEVQDIIEKFDFRRQISRLQSAKLLYPLLKAFENVDLHPKTISPHDMGYIFEDLIRRFNEQDNQTAGEHFTPREVIELMVDLLLSENPEAFLGPDKIVEIYDPACGTGGMLSEGKKGVTRNHGQKTEQVYLFGQEINPTSFAVAKADLLLKEENPRNLAFGNSFSEDGHPGKRFRLMLSNPPFGVEWKKVEYIIRNEYEVKGHDGRFGAGLPRITDGSFLFLQHMLAKRFGDAVGSRIAVIFNGSPLFTGDAGSGESEIRRWIIEHDWLEGIIALPEQMFYNTGISTYIWIVTNRKSTRRKGKVQLINAADLWVPMTPRSLGNKRRRINDKQRAQIVELYKAFQNGELGRIFDNADFGYRRIRVERPLRLNFQATPERIERLWEQKAFTALTESNTKNEAEKEKEIAAGQALQEAILATVRQLPTDQLRDPHRYQPLLDDALKPLKLKVSLQKAVLNALTERDETAPPVPGKRSEWEPDTDLRDHENVPLTYTPSLYDENVPLKLNVYDYFVQEVKRYIDDAWIDEAYRDAQDDKVGVVGYEINFNRYFYRYEPPPHPAELDEQINRLEEEIATLLKSRR
ncbi:MAG: SAM-dependent DNA methyltransferase [Chloroflexi bacterium]|nr:SAM-dependent DNA methyltransferase [Chloroflexota bacterium]MBP8056480.1 SAM-dependent DNA methyltransferase [Chloroflexota bacterium]